MGFLQEQGFFILRYDLFALLQITASGRANPVGRIVFALFRRTLRPYFRAAYDSAAVYRCCGGKAELLSGFQICIRHFHGISFLSSRSGSRCKTARNALGFNYVNFQEIDFMVRAADGILHHPRKQKGLRPPKRLSQPFFCTTIYAPPPGSRRAEQGFKQFF